MKNSILSFTVLIFVLLLNFGCEKSNNAKQCYSAKILKISCGGIVLQLPEDNNIGEEWSNADDDTLYPNCVLAGALPSKGNVSGDTIYIEFKGVDTFSTGNFCDIGGLPPTKIEIQNMYNNSCSK